MPTNSKKMPETDLSAILEGLIKADIEFILVEGLAAVIQGAPVTTMDVDIVHRQSPSNISKLFAFLKSIDSIYRRPDNKVIAPKKEDFSAMGHALLSTRLGPLDVLAFIEEGKKYEDLTRHSIEIEFRGNSIKVLDIRKLIELKKDSKDPAETQRLSVLEETLRQMNKK
jgi:hypothetical protein